MTSGSVLIGQDWNKFFGVRRRRQRLRQLRRRRHVKRYHRIEKYFDVFDVAVKQISVINCS